MLNVRNAQKKAIHMLQRSSHTPTQEIKQTPSSPCYTYGTGAVTLKWNMGILLTKVTHGVCDPKELRATTSCDNILYLGSGLSNTRLFAGRPRYQRRSQEPKVPEVDFLSNRHPAKFTSEKP
jgi:hypothetical protein